MEQDANLSEERRRGWRGVSWRAWLTIALCAVYVLSPVDLVPESLLGPFGLPDDLVAILVAVKVGRSSRKANRREE